MEPTNILINTDFEPLPDNPEPPNQPYPVPTTPPMGDENVDCRYHRRYNPHSRHSTPLPYSRNGTPQPHARHYTPQPRTRHGTPHPNRRQNPTPTLPYKLKSKNKKKNKNKNRNRRKRLNIFDHDMFSDRSIINLIMTMVVPFGKILRHVRLCS